MLKVEMKLVSLVVTDLYHLESSQTPSDQVQAPRRNNIREQARLSDEQDANHS
jgi:hypothetical protein